MLKLKLNKATFIAINLMVFGFIAYKSFFLLNEVKNREIEYELLLAFLSSLLSIVPFTYSWYKLGKPRLTDWVKFSTFLYLIFNYYDIANLLDSKEVGIYAENYVNISYVYGALLTVVIGLMTINIVDFLFIFFGAVKNKNVLNYEIQNKYILRNEKLFIISSLSFIGLMYLLLALGVIGYGASDEVNIGSFSFIFQVINIVSPIFYLSYLILKYSMHYNSRMFNIAFKTYMFLYILFGLIAGMKGILIFGIVLFLIPYLNSGRKINIKYVVFSFLFLLILYPLNNNYRDILVKNPGVSKIAALQVATAQTVSLNFGKNVSSSTNSYTDRIAMLPYLVFALEKEKDWNNYKNLDRFIYLPVSLIPRFILSNKPQEDNGAKLQEMIVKGIRNSPTPTMYGWAYLEGGFIYVVFHFLLLSVVLNYVDFCIKKKSIFHLIFYANLLVKSIIIEQDVYFFIASLFQMILVYYFFTKFFFVRSYIK
ncbi:hypothetical protein QX233_13820 [Chryseobacterium gambrini]|uniref:Uncharacterized protein n=1 Tax=Chryseobacterium gambrini TaxID=373672 RepID=A0AAJ1VJV7_9FLAO|nr:MULTISPECIES: hypothetical protein [Chryseobacterium]MDN4013550.1 hypothetical protein [Chryseobacterium gambrini]MDN4029038.1 hypothetical protein [Chryseobacterium gambrini]QWA40255.1 hypothetical protein KKI44_08625 [Chryseobacterium sp. ZHDP1]